jgi:hypothetical protein
VTRRRRQRKLETRNHSPASFSNRSVQQKWLQLVEMKQPGFSECNSALTLNAENIEVGEEPKPIGRRALDKRES